MTRREVWIVCLVIAMMGIASLAYRLTTTTHFDPGAWREAHDSDNPSKFLQRRAMMPEVEKMFATGKIRTQVEAQGNFGRPDRTADENPNDWFYNLGGQTSTSAPDSITWLELTFDDSGRLLSHKQTQELIVPVVQ
jgi:hypothetical protein